MYVTYNDLISFQPPPPPHDVLHMYYTTVKARTEVGSTILLQHYHKCFGFPPNQKELLIFSLAI